MSKKDHNNAEEGKRYLKKFEIVETDVELPIQGQVRDPEDLYQFLRDLESESVPKVIGIYLDEELVTTGEGLSKQEAQVDAAKKALEVKKW